VDYNEIVSRLNNVKGHGDQHTARCPAHDDKNNSLSIARGRKGQTLFKCHAGCTTESIVAALGLAMSDLFPAKINPSGREIVATYDYHDESGKMIFQKVRYANKGFSQRQPDGKGGWAYNLKGIAKPPLYRLPEVLEAVKGGRAIYIVEGEKDADNLRAKNKIATCGHLGAAPGKWLSHYNDCLHSSHIIIIADNDDVGKKFADEIAQKVHPVAKSLRLLDLTKIAPDLPEHGDISDILGMKNIDGIAELDRLVKATPQYTPPPPKKDYICLSDIEPLRTSWTWEPYIPAGKITVIQGDPGAGKTFFTLYLATIVSRGDFFPEEDLFEPRKPAAVVYQTAEDGIADTIVPRLKKMNPNFDNIFCIDETEQGLTLSDARIEKILKEKSPRLFIIDPLQAYLGGDVDMHRANQVRPLMAKLGRLAEQYQCAFILVMHMSKMSGAKALYRGLGSIDFVAAARSVLVIGSNPEDTDEKIMAHEKSSLSKHGESISFSLDYEKGVVINGTSPLTADDILNGTKGGRGRAGGTRDDAMDLLTDMLSKNGYALKADIEKAADAAGISQRTLYRARQDMELKSLSLGYGGKKKSYWMLPSIDKSDISISAEQQQIIEYPGTWPPQ